MVLPYLGTQSLRLKKRLNKLFKEQLPSGKLKIVFRTTQRMSSCFRFIEAIPCSLLSGIIYEYKCPKCNSRYIVSTYRYWEKGLEEHLHISSLMDSTTTTPVSCQAPLLNSPFLGNPFSLIPSYLLKVTKFFCKISQFEFLVMTEKNIFAYKLFLSLNISDFSLFFM